MTACSSYSCQENSMDRGADRLQSIGLQKSQTELSDWAHTYTHREKMEERECLPTETM